MATTQQLLYELQVHQIELEMQNEELRRAQAELETSHARYFNFYDMAPVGYCSVREKGLITQVNLATATLLGLPRSDLIQQPIGRFVFSDDQDSYYLFQRKLHKTGASLSCELRLIRNEGAPFWAQLVATLAGDDKGAPELRIVISDITERKSKEAQLLTLAAALRDSEAHFRLLTENVSDVVWQLDRDGRFTYISPADEQLRGYRSDEVIGHHAFDLMTDEGIALATEIDRQLAASEPGGVQTRPITFETQQLCKDGSLVWTEILSMPEHDSTGAITGYHGITRDITERKRVQDQVRQLAFYDPLTQLPNRRLLDDRLSQSMANSKRSGRYGAVMMLDLDNFKPLNDKHGHSVGDLLLVEAARRMISCVREVDTVARVGGDEFVVMLGELDADQAESTAQAQAIAEKIRLSMAQVFVLDVSKEAQAPSTVEHHCSASIGVVLFVNQEAPQGEVLKWADAAMYQAKDAGRNLIRFYAPKGQA